jgi:hypothetical protein
MVSQLNTIKENHKMSMKKLVTNWSLPDRTAERAQLTLRLDFDSYARLHALKEIYPKRSVNDMINDILKSGLDEIIEALPSHELSQMAAYEAGYQDEEGNPPREAVILGPRIDFNASYRKILETKAEEETKEEAA